MFTIYSVHIHAGCQCHLTFTMILLCFRVHKKGLLSLSWKKNSEWAFSRISHFSEWLKLWKFIWISSSRRDQRAKNITIGRSTIEGYWTIDIPLQNALKHIKGGLYERNSDITQRWIRLNRYSTVNHLLYEK